MWVNTCQPMNSIPYTYIHTYTYNIYTNRDHRVILIDTENATFNIPSQYKLQRTWENVTYLNIIKTTGDKHIQTEMFALESRARQCCHSLHSHSILLSFLAKAVKQEKRKKEKRKIKTLYFLTYTDSRSN